MKARITKQRDSEIGEVFYYDLMSICIGYTDDGEEISVPIVRELQDIREIKPLKGHKKIALELLQNLSENHEEITKSDWQTAFIKSTQTKGGPNEKSLARVFRRVADHLRTNGYTKETGQNVLVL